MTDSQDHVLHTSPASRDKGMDAAVRQTGFLAPMLMPTICVDIS